MKQLSTKRPSRELRWTFAGGQSVRTYVHERDERDCPCVSTRSAELTVVLDGEVAIEVGPARQVIRIGQGEVVWVPRGLAHVIHVPARTRALVVDHVGAGPDTLHHLPAHAVPAAVLRALRAAWERGGESAFDKVATASAELLQRLGGRAPIEIESAACTRKMHAAKRLLEERFIRPPTLAELARRIGTSEFYLVRNFKRHFGFTPYAYAQFLRTEHFFWELLSAPEDRPRLLALSADAGWGDYSTFERRMRALTGKPPSLLLRTDPDLALGPI